MAWLKGQRNNCLLIALTVCLALISLSSACVIPVFRYAMERWHADDFQIVILLDSTLSQAEQQKLADVASHASYVSNPELIDSLKPQRLTHNVSIQFYQKNSTDEQAKFLWNQIKPKSLPWAILRYPPYSGIEHDLYSGSIANMPLQELFHSKERKELVDDLLKGQTAVWMFLESGDKTKDAAALEQLNKGIGQATKTVKLPDMPEDELPGWFDPSAAPEMRIEFGIVKISHSDTNEKWLREMLRHSEPKLLTMKEPMAFAVFGRGRVLPALTGDQITVANVVNSVIFLCGQCSCEIKEENPGFDILLTADWESFYYDRRPVGELPPLTGISDFVDGQATEKIVATSTPPSKNQKTAVAEEKAVESSVAKAFVYKPITEQAKPSLEPKPTAKEEKDPEKTVAVEEPEAVTLMENSDSMTNDEAVSNSESDSATVMAASQDFSGTGGSGMVSRNMWYTLGGLALFLVGGIGFMRARGSKADGASRSLLKP